GCVHDRESDYPPKFLEVERSDLVIQRQTRRADLQIMRPDHLAARFKVRPNAGMNTRLCEIEWLDRQSSENLLDMALASPFPRGILRAFYSVEQLGSGHGGNEWLDSRELAQKTGHVELSALVRDQQRTVKD